MIQDVELGLAFAETASPPADEKKRGGPMD
jgi:hypothetical protein